MEATSATEVAKDKALIRVFDMINERLGKINETLQHRMADLENKLQFVDAQVRTAAAGQTDFNERLTSLQRYLRCVSGHWQSQ